MKKDIKVCLLDFDGTLVNKDILTLLCGINGKLEESRELNDKFNRGELKGLESLIARINLISGITKSQIAELLNKNNYLMPGAEALIKFLKENQVITILASGSPLSVLGFYQKLLGIDYIIGSNPNMTEDTIAGITESSYSSEKFKLDGIKNIIDSMNLTKENIIAIGDSPADQQMFEISGYKIAINPKGDIANFADVVIENDLSKAIDILKSLGMETTRQISMPPIY